MSNKPSQLLHLADALYEPPSRRRDNCGRCWHATVHDHADQVRLTCGAHGAAEVKRYGVCAMWREAVGAKVAA